MSDQIRLAAGNIPAYTFLNTSSYLVTNWTRQADMTPAIQWLAVQPNPPLTRIGVNSLEIGVGALYGRYGGSGIEFPIMTEDMRQYIATNIFGSDDRFTAQVTVYLETPKLGFTVFVGELTDAFGNNSFERFDNNIYSSVFYPFNRGTVKTITYLLQENGDYLLQENGDRIVLEQQT